MINTKKVSGWWFLAVVPDKVTKEPRQSSFFVEKSNTDQRDRVLRVFNKHGIFYKMVEINDLEL